MKKASSIDIPFPNYRRMYQRAQMGGKSVRYKIYENFRIKFDFLDSSVA